MYPQTSHLPWTRNFFNLYALIICINEYSSKEFPRLDSAIHDGLRFEKYLIDKLTVPKSQIRILIGPAASRNNIIQELQSFPEDGRIQKGDAIVIFFAGHGNEILAPPSWPSNVRHCVQSIVPQDYCSTRGLEVPCIPDRTIAALLKAIAQKKGNNITVIFDCCHAASGTRSAGDRARCGNKRIVIDTEDLDCEYWGAGTDADDQVLYPVPEFCHDGHFSHTLIAACGPSEVAVECGEYGRFSNALNNLLETVPPEKIRYSQLLNLMARIQGQNPQVEGVDLDRFLFNAKPYAPPPPFNLALVYDAKSYMHMIPVGTAHGIVDGTLFDLKSDNGPNAMDMGTMVVENSMPFYSHVRPHKGCLPLPTDPQSTVVVVHRKVQTRPHRLCLYIAREGRHYQAMHQQLSCINRASYGLNNIEFVQDPANARVKVAMSRGKLAFQLLDSRLGRYNPPVKISFSSDAIAAALKSISEFLWELDRTNKSDLIDDVELSVYRLEQRPIKFETEVLMEMVPVDDDDLCENDEVDLVFKGEQRLGISLINTGDRPLYPVLQYFAFHRLGKIVTLYQPPISGPYHLEAPLQVNQTLTIGFGSGGMPPLCLTLHPTQDVGVGYLKLSLFTQPINFGSDGRGTFQHNRDQYHNGLEDTWGTYTIPVTLRRHPVQTPVVETPLSSKWPNANQRAVTHFPEQMVSRTYSTPNQTSVRMK